MTDPDHPIDYIDYTLIRFPSDGITVRDLRRLHPGELDVEQAEGHLGRPAFWVRVGEILLQERLIARAALVTLLRSRATNSGHRLR